MVVKNVWKYPKKRNKIKGHSITCSHIWNFRDVFLRNNEILVLDMCVVSLKYRSKFPHCTVQIKIHHKVPILQVYTIITLHYFYVVYNTIHDEINMNWNIFMLLIIMMNKLKVIIYHFVLDKHYYYDYLHI